MAREFSDYFELVRPIIYKLKRCYHIQLWERDDWEQEGRMILFQLMSNYPEILSDSRTLCVYFKTKFSNHVKDTLRKQGSQKRRFELMAYEEISEVGHSVGQKGLLLDEYVAYSEALDCFRATLSVAESQQLDALLAGERFKGRQALKRRLAVALADFRD